MNHFIEIGQTKDDKESIWLTIHTGSRNLGVKILNYWKKQLRKTREINSKTVSPSRFLVEKEEISGYLQDTIFAQVYAEYNRITISERIKKILNLGKELETIESIHNYISPEDHIIRKGSIQSYPDKKVIIPMNMAYGTLICTGLGNADWNYSAPHGAGRLLSRKEAKELITIEDFKNSMNGVYSRSICSSCIDESPGAYKDPEEIISLIGDTVSIIDIIKPLISIKSGTIDDYE